MDAKESYPALGRWLDQVESTLGERTLLVCLDEFEEVEKAIHAGRFDTFILSTVRNIVPHRRRIAVLLSGSHQINELPPHWASALVTTTSLPISFLDEADARELITQPVADFPAIYTPEAVDRIISLTRCQPYLVQLVCALLVDVMNRNHRLPPASFVTALERGQNYFYDLWSNQTGGEAARRILAAMAHAEQGRLSKAELHQIERGEEALREALATLLRREIIEADGNGYRVTVPLVAEYVRRERPMFVE